VSGNTALYTYDAVGNLLSISQQPASLLSIIDFTPKSGPVGTDVPIYGSGFSTTATQNTVKFNGVVATVASSSATQLNATVPAGATTGPISVTVGTNTVTSSVPLSPPTWRPTPRRSQISHQISEGQGQPSLLLAPIIIRVRSITGSASTPPKPQSPPPRQRVSR
jgi:hypothetical protein